MGHEKKVAHAYLREMISSMAVYVVLLICAIKFGRPLPDGMLRTAVLLAPMIGFFLAIWAVARHLNRIDEYQRRVMLDTVAIGAAVTAAVTFSYGFLETAGFPRLSMFAVWPIMGASWAVVCLGRWLLKR